MIASGPQWTSPCAECKVQNKMRFQGDWQKGEIGEFKSAKTGRSATTLKIQSLSHSLKTQSPKHRPVERWQIGIELNNSVVA